MPAAILGFLGPLLPYLIGFVAIVAGYFSIKWKGASEEKARQEKKQAAAVAQIAQQVDKAVSQDAKVDEKVAAQVKSIEEKHETVPVDAPGRFTF